MKIRRFLNIVPKTVQLWASGLAGCAFLIGLAVGYRAGDPGTILRTMVTFAAAALVVGVLLAIWLLCLGFVFADARRRDMRAVLWVLVAALFPHLLGFLLYFVLRQPIAATCTHCGMTLSHSQRFCSSCGASLVPQDTTGGPLTATGLQGAGR
jgi:Phospholipase_D-nuclease N-terminal/zinc-ribbon domain